MNICKGCNKEVKSTDLRYAANEYKGEYWHGACWTEKGDGILHDMIVKFPSQMKNIKENLEKIRERLKELDRDD